MRRDDPPTPALPLWFYGVVFFIAGAGLLWGCASPPAPVDDRPVVHIFRQYVIVPVPVAPEEQCCWYEPPADTDYGPI